MTQPDTHMKDAVLDRLARHANVAQFVSYAPDLSQRFAWVHGHEPNHAFASLEEGVTALLAASPENSVNVRSFDPVHSKSRDFVYGLTSVGDVLEQVRRLAGNDLHTIVNETVDVDDGGVSGVAFGAVIEFAPKDTPRCVEKPGTAALPRAVALRAFEIVYGFAPELPDDPALRVEFSIHPLRRGYRHTHTILWEEEHLGADVAPTVAHVSWPNRYSQFIGDKCYGILVAHCLGLPVPRTHVVARNVAPFAFGEPTGTHEVWIRTCPVVQRPGLFTTHRGWLDPYRLLAEEDPEGTDIGSILRQDGVDARFSGSLLTQSSGEPLVEGVSGLGDAFMSGTRAPEDLPDEVRDAVLGLFDRARRLLGPVRFEWVHDGTRVWAVQLHVGASDTEGRTLFPGDPDVVHRLPVSAGIDALRALIDRVSGTGEGIVLEGHVGVTSHMGDLLRKARIPSRIETPDA